MQQAVLMCNSLSFFVCDALLVTYVDKTPQIIVSYFLF